MRAAGCCPSLADIQEESFRLEPTCASAVLLGVLGLSIIRNCPTFSGLPLKDRPLLYVANTTSVLYARKQPKPGWYHSSLLRVSSPGCACKVVRVGNCYS
jgi:hypothetical protein